MVLGASQSWCPVTSHGDCVAWAADRTLIIYNTNSSRFESQEIARFEDSAAHAENTHAHTKPHTDTIRAISFSPDGGSIASAGEDKRVLVWTRNSSKDLWTCSSEYLHSKRIMAVQFDKTGNLFFADKFGEFFLLKQNQISLMFGHLSAVSSVLYSGARNLLVSADRDEKIRLAQYPSVEHIQSFLFGHRRYVCQMTFIGKDHLELVSAGADGRVIHWDIRDPCTPKKMFEVEFPSGPINSVVATDGAVLVVRSEDADKLFFVKNGAIAEERSLDFSVQAMHVLSNGAVVCVDSNSHLRWLDGGGEVRLPADVPGVAVSLMKVVHHENDEEGILFKKKRSECGRGV